LHEEINKRLTMTSADYGVIAFEFVHEVSAPE